MTEQEKRTEIARLTEKTRQEVKELGEMLLELMAENAKLRRELTTRNLTP